MKKRIEIEAELEILIATWSDDHPELMQILQRFPSEIHAKTFLNRLKETGKGTITEETREGHKVLIWKYENCPF